ncbi:MAG: hypothetical protein COB30_014055 [Ectothiorhodospiraceae bacterium]|nr:hypothetical protein [Ectothiorhodospiraceae bacterium]
MVGFLKKIFSSGETKAPSPKKRADMSLVCEALPIAKLMELLRYFPLGENVSYYPEYQKEGALGTLVLGYSVNEHHIFSAIDIRCEQENSLDIVKISIGGEEQTVRAIDSFSLLIPFNIDDENKRDYVRRAELGPLGPFRRHNSITLSACSTGGIISTIDTVVRRVIPLKSGIYAGHEVVVLDVHSKSLSLTDQRAHYRLQTTLPATLTIRDGETHECTLMDFSEESVQLKFETVSADLMALTEYRHLTLNFSVATDSRNKLYSLDGVMFRKTDASLVMKLLGIYKNGKLEALGLVDILDIKASLLQHPETQKALQSEREK